MIKFERLDGEFVPLDWDTLYNVECDGVIRVMSIRYNDYDTTSPLYLYAIDDHNGWIFRKLDIDKYAYVKEILGYQMEGDWPPQKTIEDLNKVAERLSLEYGVTFEERATGDSLRGSGRL